MSSYRPQITGPWEAPLPSIVNESVTLQGSGAPEGVVHAWPGSTYIDNTAGNQYLKMRGEQALGWKLIGAVSETYSTAAAEVYYGTTDPNGVVTAQRPALYYQSNGAVWAKFGTGLNAVEWYVLLAA